MVGAGGVDAVLIGDHLPELEKLQIAKVIPECLFLTNPLQLSEVFEPRLDLLMRTVNSRSTGKNSDVSRYDGSCSAFVSSFS